MTDKEFTDMVLGIEGNIVDQLDFRSALLQQIRLCQLSALYSNRLFANSVLMFLTLIPEQDWDDKFREDIKNCSFIVEYGSGRYIHDTTHDHRTEIVNKTIVYDYMRLFHSIINLLRRRGVLWRDKEVETIP